jgi:2-oxoglutarate ferredoxin oxidoreductase subunit alpha
VRSTRPDWALTGAKDRDPNLVSSIYLKGEEMEAYNKSIQERLGVIKKSEQRWKEYFTEDIDLLVVGYGTAGRIAYSAVEEARAKGLKVGLFRPQTLWPFPEKRLSELADTVESVLVVEMNAGQMLEDVRLAVGGQIPVSFYGRMGGVVPMPDEILEAIESEYEKLNVRVAQ